MNEQTRREIDRRISRVLKDAGFREPPIGIEAILECLNVHRDYYDLDDPSLLQRFYHKIQVGGLNLGKMAKKIRLAAIWMPDREQIFVDKTLPPVKQDWASFHDATHTILKWHRPFFLGDTSQTLDPDFQEMLENEANYGASALMFGRKMFTRDGLDTRPEWASIEALQKRYKKSLVATLRRYIEFTHDLPMIMMVSTPDWLEIPGDQKYQWRHLVPSNRFSLEFGEINPGYLLNLVNANIQKRRGGLIGSFEFALDNLNGDPCGFRAE